MSRAPADRSEVVTGVTDDLPVLPGATTSRALIDNDAVRVVMFTFDQGEQLTEHTASMPVVVQLLAGRMRFEVGGEGSLLAPGDLVYLAPKEPHALEALEPSRLALTLVLRSPDRELASTERH